jgi:membrane-associated phospholipid phosphatase
MDFLENELGLAVVEWFQTPAGAVLSYILYPFHLLGSQYAYLVIIPIVLWSIDKETGKRLLVFLLLTAFINGFLKISWARPRPFTVSPGTVTPFVHAEGYGLPSGHSMMAAAVGVWLMLRMRRPLLYWAAPVYILLTGLSRIVHGVHYPQDVLVGWLLGAAAAAGFYFLEPRISARLKRSSQRSSRKCPGISLRLTVPVLTIFAAALVFFLVLFVNPSYAARSSVLQIAGALLGGIAGLSIEGRQWNFSSGGSVRMRILRAAAGLIMLGLVYIGLQLLFRAAAGGREGLGILLLYYARYYVTAFVLAWAVPGVFILLSLAEARNKPSAQHR